MKKCKNRLLTAALALCLAAGLPAAGAACDANEGAVGNHNYANMGMHGFLDSEGGFWIYGQTGDGQIGNFSVVDQVDPLWDVNTDHSIKRMMEHVTAFSGTSVNVAVIKEDNSLWMWGRNAWGQLGFYGGNTFYPAGPSSELPPEPYQTIPVKVMDDAAAVSCGTYHTAAIKTDGSLWTWGCSSYGALGNGEGGEVYSGKPRSSQANPVKVLDDVVAVGCDGLCTAAIQSDGSLWMWGSNNWGELGTGLTGNHSRKDEVWQDTPLKVMDDVASVSCGDGTTAWTWGRSSIEPIDYLKDISFRLPGGGATPIPPASGMAADSAVSVSIDGAAVPFQAYALTDKTGGVTNYLRLRDVARALNGTAAQFQVDWDGTVCIIPRRSYSGTSADKVPFSGVQPYRRSSAPTKINGVSVDLEAIILTDGDGNDYTYYKLRDLGKALDFNVTWDAGTGVAILTAQPYSDH